MKLTKGEKIIAIFLILYLTLYFALILIKYALWGSDILYLIWISQHIDFHHFLSPQRGYPQGLPLFLEMESSLGGLSPYIYIKLHIALVFIFIIFLTFLVSFKISKNIKTGFLSALIASSVYPCALIMSPQYAQAVNIAILLVLSSLLFFIFFENTHKNIYLILSFFPLSILPILHRPSTFIVGLTLLVYFILIISERKINWKKKIMIILIFFMIISVLSVVIYTIYLPAIKEYITNSTLTEYGEHNVLGYFPNYDGWELLPLLLIFFIFYFKKYKKYLPNIFIAFIIVVFGINILYMMGYTLLNASVVWRSANYSLYIVSLLAAIPLIEVIRKISKNTKKFTYTLFGIVGASLPLYILDVPIQKYIFRATTGTVPERIKILIIGGKYAPYIFVSGVLIVLIFTGLLILYAYSKNKKHKKFKLIIKRGLPIFLIFILISPRIFLSAVGFYLLPPDISDNEYNLFKYIKINYPDRAILSDPQTMYFAVGYGLHTRLALGDRIYKDYAPIWGPPDAKGCAIPGWARMLDKWIKDKDINSIYNFMIKSNDSLLVINIEWGRLVDYQYSKRGNYITMPETILEFKKVVDSDSRFNLIYAHYSGGMYIYEVVK